MTVDIWIRDYNPPRCFQKKISGRGKHNDFKVLLLINWKLQIYEICHCMKYTYSHSKIKLITLTSTFIHPQVNMKFLYMHIGIERAPPVPKAVYCDSN
jgi:hypothetical protein